MFKSIFKKLFTPSYEEYYNEVMRQMEDNPLTHEETKEVMQIDNKEELIKWMNKKI